MWSGSKSVTVLYVRGSKRQRLNRTAGTSISISDNRATYAASLRPIPESGEGSRSRFKWYSAYAWGCPLIVGLVTIGMQQIDANKHPELILPGFGVKKCWFAEQAALWLYFYGFVLLLTVINIIFFMQVAYILIQAQRVNKTILRNTRQDKDRMKLYVKLFVVMGVTWICEVISFQEGTCEVWMVTDIINSLQGVFIFIIFVCKRTVFQKLRGKCDPGISRVKRIVRSTSSYATTSMSQRTTQISLDSMRGSSMNQSTLTAKSPNNSISNSGGNMQVIHETAVDSQLSETSANSRMEEKSPSSVHINGSPPAMVGDVVSARGGGGTDYPRTGAGVVSARGGGAVVQGETGMVSARGGLREEVTYQLPDEGLADDGPPSPNSMTVDVTVHDQQLLQQ
ncbi:GPCR family 2 secretin-like [Trinorchestia longiramus]|nr:GPCR family 2 secretin-like [Trinorchestia longiramus]